MNEFGKPEECLCKSCPLQRQPFCPNEENSRARSTWLGESPGGKEILAMVPFRGPSGKRLMQNARVVGLSRSDAQVGNAVLCRPLKGMTDSQWTKAVTACKPHLEAFLSRCKGPILAMGKWALNATTGKESIEKWYGYPLDSKFGRVLPAPHPARVLRQPHWAGEWLECLRRFCDILEGEWEEWQNPPMFWREPGWALANRLNAMGRSVVCIDAETAGTDPQFDDVICFGASDGEAAVTLIWPPDQIAHEAFRRLIWEAEHLTAHNAQHDLLVLEKLSIPYRPESVTDTLHQHAVLQPEMPHKLGVACASKWRAPRWKSIHDDESDGWATMLEEARRHPTKMDELCEYNGLDCFHGANLCKVQLKELANAKENKRETLELLSKRAPVALDMRRRGIKVDMEARRKKLEHFALRRDLARDRFDRCAAAGLWPETDLGKKGTTGAVRELFFEHFGLYPLAFTDSGNAKLDAWSLQRWAAGFQATRVQALASKLILRYRTASHIHGMVESLSISPDGRVHPPWNPWGALTDRWSCGRPNMMNLPKHGINNLRTLFVPDEGHTFILADSDKVELRVVAILACDRPLLQAFAAGVDVHQANAVDLFGEGATKRHRDLAKRMVYGFNYGASAETVWRDLVSQYPKLQLKVVEQLRRRWFQRHPAIKDFLDKNLATALRTGTLAAGVGPRTWEFYEGQVDPNEVYNRPIQATVAWVINRAVVNLHNAGWKIAVQCHDEIVLNVPIAEKHKAATALVDAMQEEVELLGRKWVLPAEAEEGISWGLKKPLEKS